MTNTNPNPNPAALNTDSLARIWMSFADRKAAHQRDIAALETSFSGLKVGRRETRNIEIEDGALTFEIVVRYRNGTMNGTRSMRVYASSSTDVVVWSVGVTSAADEDRVRKEVGARFEEFCAAATLTADTKTLARAAAWDAMLKTSGGTPERQEARRAWQRTISADR